MTVVEQLKGTTVEELWIRLDEEPRYVLYVHKMERQDGRVQQLLTFTVFLPEDMEDAPKATYLQPIDTLCRMLKVEKHFTLDNAYELDELWLMEQLRAAGRKSAV